MKVRGITGTLVGNLKISAPTVLFLLVGGVAGLLVFRQSLVGTKTEIDTPRPATRVSAHRPTVVTPATLATLQLNGVPLARFFDGLQPVRRFSIDYLTREEHPKLACLTDSIRLSWIDRVMNVRIVKAQSLGPCNGAYWEGIEYYCTQGNGCQGNPLSSTTNGGSQYNQGFQCCVYCPGGTYGSCGTAYPVCNNQET